MMDECLVLKAMLNESRQLKHYPGQFYDRDSVRSLAELKRRRFLYELNLISFGNYYILGLSV